MTFPLLIAALIPAVVLCIYLFYKDRVEKEPIGLLAKLLLFGVISCFPAILGEEILYAIIGDAFSGAMYQNEAGEIFMSSKDFHIYQFFLAFIGVALVEEFCKWILLIFGTKKNRNFDHLFDGIIYATFVSIGFAAYENIGYVFNYGFQVAVTRAIFSVPGHMFFGVMMGYYYSFWHITDQTAELEKRYMALGKIPVTNTFDSSKNKWLSLVVPVLFHGFYDFCLFVGSPLTTTLFYIFVIFMYVYCFRKIRQMSANDSATIGYAKAMLIRKYPAIREDITNDIL